MVLLLVASVISLFIGVIELPLQELLSGNLHLWEIFLVSRLPRLLAILCTGVGMSVAGLIMQQLCSNKFGVAHNWRHHFFGPAWHSAGAAVHAVVYFVDPGALCLAAAILGTWIFVWFIQRHPV